MKHNFKVGDTVWLKGGSPKLTVTRDDFETVEVRVGWFFGGEFKEIDIPIEALTKEPRSAKSKATR